MDFLKCFSWVFFLGFFLGFSRVFLISSRFSSSFPRFSSVPQLGR